MRSLQIKHQGGRGAPVRLPWTCHRQAGAPPRRALAMATLQPEIKLIASDVDGTLLNHLQQLTPGVEAAVKQAAALGVPVRAIRSVGHTCHQPLPTRSMARCPQT